ncbi:MAG TPA: peptidylprolyl isomerase [Trebonia sp.]|nr:peptidylprolyl isomerase [Trebonia sp.]
MHTVIRKLPFAFAVVLALSIGGCSSGRRDSAAAYDSSAATVAGATKSCAYTPTAGSGAPLPPAKTNPSLRYTATMHTSQGNIAFSLLNSQAPCTVNSFMFLAQTGFWTSTQCHRLSTGGGLYMLQCGDPTAKSTKALGCGSNVGSGGPGYTFGDENLTSATYPAGTVAMANAGPNTNGSQFFLVFQASQLPPDYTPFGTITAAGLAVLHKVAKAGTTCTFAGAGGGVPRDKVVINSVAIAKGLQEAAASLAAGDR